MYRYVCGLHPDEYEEWISDRSTATTVIVFSTPEVDALLCDPRAWIPFALYSVWSLIQLPIFTGLILLEQILMASIAAMTLTLGEIAALSGIFRSLPHRTHFLLFGVSQKFRLTDWKTNTLFALLVVTLCALCGYPLACLAVIAIQVIKHEKWRN